MFGVSDLNTGVIGSFGTPIASGMPVPFGVSDVAGGTINPMSMGSGIASFGSQPSFNLTGQGGGGLFSGMTGLQKIGAGLSGIQTIGGLISSFGALDLAKKQFNLQRDVLNTNLNNQITAYNTALDDKARSRAVMEGQSDSERDAYIEKNKARR